MAVGQINRLTRGVTGWSALGLILDTEAFFSSHCRDRLWGPPRG